ncbi:hypothetical protein [uncultured Draconibacterium sp.]|uniref:hypothetical protein n=1 Tax=uncultured Draconibacterium sp. TaxID=1573823 RepID=UPI003261BCFF
MASNVHKEIWHSLLFFICLFTISACSNDIYVSPKGNDANKGSKNAPLQTLAAAQQAVRNLKKEGVPNGGINIYLHGGTYNLDETLVFSEEDSGEKGKAIKWQAVEGETPVISGGQQVKGWQEWKNGIWWAPLNRETKLRALYVNQRAAKMAKKKSRIKAQGWYGQFEITGQEPWAMTEGTRADGLMFNSDELPLLKNAEDIEIRNQTTWTMNRISLREMVREGNYTIALLQQPFGAIAQMHSWGCALQPDSEYEVFNALEFLDEPGEFYFDREAKKLYYYPLDNEVVVSSEVIVPVLEQLVVLKGTNRDKRIHDLTFEGITFAHTHWEMMRVENSTGATGVQANALATKYIDHGNWHLNKYTSTDLSSAAVSVYSADRITFANNRFELNEAMSLNLENHVTNAKVIGNIFWYSGSVAINVGHPQHVYIGRQNGDNYGWGPYHIDNSKDKYDETEEGLCEQIEISNNLTRHTSWEHPPSFPINVFYAADLNIAHNDIGTTPYGGIAVGWGWWEWLGNARYVEEAKNKPSQNMRNIKVNYNKIEGAVNTLHDCGAIYFLGRLEPEAKDGEEQKYAEIQGNYILNMHNGHLIRGMHPDAGTQYCHFFNNVFDIPEGMLTICATPWQDKGRWLIEDNYTTATPIWNHWPEKGPNNTVEIRNNYHVPDKNWPEAAKAIIENAGLEEAYKHLFELIEE